MILNKKLSKVEKLLIVKVDDNYITLYCEEHGIFQKRVDINDNKCIYCKKSCEIVENLQELKDKYKSEFN